MSYLRSISSTMFKIGHDSLALVSYYHHHHHSPPPHTVWNQMRPARTDLILALAMRDN